MDFSNENNTRERFHKLNPRQQHIILNLLSRIKTCEGSEAPQSRWCPKCAQTHIRAMELFMRFEKINRLATIRPPDYGFSDPTITGGFD